MKYRVDFIPMHHSLNDYIDFVDEGRGLVIGVNNNGCIARLGDGRIVLWDYRLNKLSEASDETQQEFASRAGDTEETTNTNTNMSTAVTVAELADYEDGQAIACFEGVVGKLYDAKTGTSKGRKWSFQSGFIKDDNGDEHRITFAGVENQQDADAVKGKRVRLTPSTVKGKVKGLSMKISDKTDDNGDNYRNIQVDEGCKIEWVGGAKQETGGTKARDEARSSGAHHRASSPEDDGEIDHSPVSVRVKEYFDVMQVVQAEIKERSDMPKFSSSDIKEITTGICMSYKGKYGVFMRPVFGGADEKPQSTDPEKGNGKDAHGWKEFIHPKRGTALGEMPVEDYDGKSGLARLILWAKTCDPKKVTGETALLRDALLEAASDTGLDGAKLMNKLFEIEGLDNASIKFIMERDLGGTSLTPKQCDGAFKNWPALVAEIKAYKPEPEQEAEEEMPE